MNISIVCSNRSKNPVAVMPLGACIVAEAAERAGHRVRVLDLMFEKNPVRFLEEELKKSKPEIVGISVRNIDNNNMEKPKIFYEDLIPIVSIIRKITNSKIVLGGSAVGVMPEELLRYTGASYAIRGSGEIAFPDLLSALSEGKDPGGIAGLAWIENDRYKSMPVKFSSSTDCIVPDFPGWIDIKAYLSMQATIPVQTKRGCPYQCVYCTYALSEGKTYQLYSPESVVRTIKRLKIQGFKDFEFVDNVFNSPYDHATAICEGLAREKTGARLQSVELNPRYVDDHLLSLMERAGFCGIGITPESASDTILKNLGKDYTIKEITEAAASVRRHHLPCLWMFLLGGPGETRESINETLRFAKEQIRKEDVAFFNLGIRIYPGTELENIARKEGILTLPREEMLKPVSYFSHSLDIHEVTITLKDYVEKNYNFITIDSFDLSILSKVYLLGNKLGLTPPLWKYTQALRRKLRFIGVRV